VAACIGLLGAGAAGCSTTQEKAERQQARATHILEARAERQKKKHKGDKSKQADRNGSQRQ
jgi:hypothetical protein